jgi:hypothetical protein
MSKEIIYCRKAPSLGDLEGTEAAAWGTLPYEGNLDAPTVFFGLYSFADFKALHSHRGKKWILWAGSDIKHFTEGYWLDSVGRFRLHPAAIAPWMNEYCESWCENGVEQSVLKMSGIDAQVAPSFMGDVRDYEITYKHSDRPKVYASVSGDDFELYRWDGIEQLAAIHKNIEFHLYGNKKEWNSNLPNVIVHGRVPKEQMNLEVMQMQGGLRLLKFDGFSEILAKSVLWGQWPISAIPYPHMLPIEELHRLPALNKANLEGRDYYLSTLNKYPWVI